LTTAQEPIAIVKKGTKKVTVVFNKEYLEQPIVNTSISLNESTSTDQSASAVEAIFNQDIRFLITNKSKKGFTITLNKSVSEDVQFSWIALAVKGAKTFESEEVKTENQNIQNNVQVVPVINETLKQEVNNNSTTTTNQANVISTTTPSSNTTTVTPTSTQPLTSESTEQVSPVNTESTTQTTTEQPATNITTTDTIPVTTESQPTVSTPEPVVIESAPAPVEAAPAPSSSESITQ
jgi:hypothetical protein